MSNKIISTVNIDDSVKTEESDHHDDVVDVENDDINLLKIILFIIKVQEDKRLPLKGEKYYDFWQVLKSKNHTSVKLYKKYKLDENPILKEDYKKSYVYDKKYTEYINSQRICTKCTVDRNLNEDFNKNSKKDSGRMYTCKECHNQQMHEYNSTYDGCVKSLLSDGKSHAKTRGKRGRIGASEFTLTKKDIKEMFKKQQGLCHHFKSKLKFTRCGDKVSLERLDNDKGYTADNCVLACKMANGFVQMTLDKIQYIIDFVEPTEEEIVNNLKKYDFTKTRKKYVKIEEKINVEGIKTYNCIFCEERKTIDKFGKFIKYGCHDCIHNEYIKPYNTIVRFCNTAKCSSKRRAAKGRPNMVCEITPDDLKDLFNKQRGRCAISGIFLQFDGKNWVLSLDRKDPSKGYTKDNIQLICGEFNTADYSAVYIIREGESDVFDCAWTPEKFLIKKKGLIEYYNKKNVVADVVEEKIIPVVDKLIENRKGKKWTEDENNRLERLYKKDVCRKEIAEMMDRTEDSIKAQILKLSL